MKSNYLVGNKTAMSRIIDDAVNQALESHKDIMYKECLNDILPQLMAVCLQALYLKGWREKRLKEFCSDVIGCWSFIDNGVLGKNYDPVDLIKGWKEMYGIDLDKDFIPYPEIRKPKTTE